MSADLVNFMQINLFASLDAFQLTLKVNRKIHWYSPLFSYFMYLPNPSTTGMVLHEVNF